MLPLILLTFSPEPANSWFFFFNLENLTNWEGGNFLSYIIEVCPHSVPAAWSRASGGGEGGTWGGGWFTRRAQNTKATASTALKSWTWNKKGTEVNSREGSAQTKQPNAAIEIRTRNPPVDIYISKTHVSVWPCVNTLSAVCVYLRPVLRHAFGPTGPRNKESFFVDQIIDTGIVKIMLLLKESQTLPRKIAQLRFEQVSFS